MNVKDLKTKSNLPAKQAGGKVVADFFQENKQAILAVLPKHLSAERLTKIALGAIRSTPKLLEATTQSLFGAVIQCAQLGLEPNTPLGHAYLVPFRNRKENRTDVQVIIGYQGMIDIARRSGQIKSISAHEVYPGDEFHYQYGLHEDLIHVPGPRSGEITHVYAVAHLMGGGHSFEVLTRQDIEATRESVLAGAPDWQRKTSPWVTHFAEMARKTAIRRLWKYLPKSIEMATASFLDETAGTPDQPDLSHVLEGDYEIAFNGGYAEQEDPEQEPVSSTQETKPTENPSQYSGFITGIGQETGEEYYYNPQTEEYWNPEKHAFPPSLTKSGSFRARRGAAGQQKNEADNSPADDGIEL